MFLGVIFHKPKHIIVGKSFVKGITDDLYHHKTIYTKNGQSQEVTLAKG